MVATKQHDILAMRAHARPVSAAARLGLRLTDSRTAGRSPVDYLATVSPSGTAIVREPIPGDVDAVIEATTAGWKALIIGGAHIDPARITGDPAAAAGLLDATRLIRV
ncbi:hypothetical protein [Actinoplanes sichuanensis]|uniref:Uncharacterized protein n=1 Tax=Actinoplanes sichuanensis TaxID=512349 RepID=A0ABW4ALG2_9ACTN|nr:hypothetical protein [Actinoplanes sichuanensis]